jgi:hypothetical protein
MSATAIDCLEETTAAVPSVDDELESLAAGDLPDADDDEKETAEDRRAGQLESLTAVPRLRDQLVEKLFISRQFSGNWVDLPATN